MIIVRQAGALLLSILFIQTLQAGVAARQIARPAAQAKALVAESISPVRVLRRADGVVFVDFGREAFGNLELNLATPGDVDAGVKIVVRLGEKLSAADHVSARPGGSVRYFQTTFTTITGQPVYRLNLPTQDARLIPDAMGPAMPFRYVELDNLPTTITAEKLSTHVLRQIAVHYPFNDAAADFVCSDEKLNAIWNLCKYTMKATSYGSRFVDGDRERKSYEADAYINQLGWYYCTDDLTLPRVTQDYLLAHPTWPTEWIMFSVLSAWLDYQYTGDNTGIISHYEDLKARTLRSLERPDGLIGTIDPPVSASVLASVHLRAKMRDIVDWPAAERDGCKMEPVNTVVNAFHCRALLLMSKLAEAIGRSDDATDYLAAYRRALASLNAKLVDPISGLYVDGEGSAHSSLHANMFPLAFGLVPEGREAKVVEFIQSRGMACSVYGAQFLMDALFDHGRGGDAIALMTAPGDRSWRHMVDDMGLTITAEAWDTKYKPNQDWNHAWGAAPANLLPRMVLGVEPLEPGYRKTLIWPRCAGKSAAGSLAWARGKVPTAWGPIDVEWRQAVNGFHLKLDVPAHVDALIRLPADWGRRVLVDGTPTSGQERNGSIEVDLSTSGMHTFAVGE